MEGSLLPLSTAQPKAPPLPVSESDDVEDNLDFGEGDEAQDGLEADDDGASASTDSDDIAALKARIAELEGRASRAEELENYYSEQEYQQQQSQADAYWQRAYDQAANWYRNQQGRIYAEADEQIAPTAYIQQRMDILNGQWTGWLQEFHSSREQAAWQFAMQQAIPNYARAVADHYGLGADAIQELLTYPPDLMPREAERIKKLNNERAALKRKATQAARQAQRNGFDPVLTGDGRVSGKRVELGSDDHYNAIPWSRGS